MQEIIGRLENWEIEKTRYGQIYWGNVYDDVRNRFYDGCYIHTSLVERREGQLIYTLNSVYELGKPSGEWPNA